MFRLGLNLTVAATPRPRNLRPAGPCWAQARIPVTHTYEESRCRPPRNWSASNASRNSASCWQRFAGPLLAGNPCGTGAAVAARPQRPGPRCSRSEEHTSELQSHLNLVCRLLLEKKKNRIQTTSAAANLHSTTHVLHA